MVRGRGFVLCLVLSLLVDSFCVPTSSYRRRRAITVNHLDSELSSSVAKEHEASDNKLSDDDDKKTTTVANEKNKSNDDDDDLDDDQPSSFPSSGGGSNIFSLLNLASALFPASSSANGRKPNARKIIQNVMRLDHNQLKLIQTRKGIIHSPSQKLEIVETNSGSAESNDESNSEDTEEDEAESEKQNNEGGSDSNQDSANDNSNDSDYEPPEGDGQGGGILGLLAGLSGDGDSDLGSLLATIGGIVANLSGDGVDINAIIATGLGLFVGLLSEGEQNPGEIIASYLLTSLDTITGGGAKNNGAFFGKFISNLVKGTSAAGDPENESGSDENGTKMADSFGFLASLLMGLLGDMSKTSSGGSWR